jgi:hypothetical protein
MGERWTAVLAAVLGLLGGMGGAAVGGYVANEGQEQRFEHERATDARNRTTDAYVQFIRAAQTEYSAGPATDDRLLRTAQAEVALATSSPSVRGAAQSLVLQAFDGEDELGFQEAFDEFIRFAQEEIGTIE